MQLWSGRISAPMSQEDGALDHRRLRSLVMMTAIAALLGLALGWWISSDPQFVEIIDHAYAPALERR